MSDIVIGFGGTGAKIVQALIMMGASSALDLPRPIKVLLVDQDKSNGNTVRTSSTLASYEKVSALVVRNAGGLPGPFSTEFEVYPGGVAQPLKVLHETLGSHFGYDSNSSVKDMNSRLMEILYDKKRIEEPLDKGFLGNPNMGAPVFADTIDFTKEPWKQLDEDIGKGQAEGGARIVLCGSVFGGTGAAGIPNVAKVLRQRLKSAHANQSKAKIILNLAMPYFSIRQVSGAAVQASGKNFLPNAKAALQYYSDQEYFDFCDSIYLLGEQHMAPIEVAHLGDLQQRNCAHPLELFAACNIRHALISDPAELDGKLFFVNRGEQNAYHWEDLPVGSANTDLVRARMGAFARFCFSFMVLREAMMLYGTGRDAGMLQQVIKPYFPTAQDINEGDLDAMRSFSTFFLEWAGEMNLTAQSISSDCKADWLLAQPLVHGDPRQLTVALNEIGPKNEPDLYRILLPNDRKDEKFKLVESLIAATKKGNALKGMGAFINTLYAVCGSSLKGFGGAYAARGGR